MFFVIPLLQIIGGFLDWIDSRKKYAHNVRLHEDFLNKRTQNFTAQHSKINHLVNFGNSFATLEDDFFVEISGGSQEEQEACRQWVEENHPEYTILD